jgi:hypothetical protein
MPELSTFLVLGLPSDHLIRLSSILSMPKVCHCELGAVAQVGSAREFWERASAVTLANQCRVYGDCDPAVILMLPSLLAQRPLTKVVWIDVSVAEARASLRKRGCPTMRAEVAAWLLKVARRYEDLFDLVIDGNRLWEPEVGAELWELCLPGVSMAARAALPVGQAEGLSGNYEKYVLFITSELPALLVD